MSYRIIEPHCLLEIMSESAAGLKVEQVEGLITLRENNSMGQSSLRKAAYVRTGLTGERLPTAPRHTNTHTTSTISCVCFLASASSAPPDLSDHLQPQ